MGRHWCAFVLLLAVIIVIAFGVLSFLSCMKAEFHKTKEKEIKLDGGLCYLPGSVAYRYGIGAIIFVSVAEFIGNVVICTSFCGQDGRIRNHKATSATLLFCILSWIIYGLAVILISTAASMNREQSYGKGWLNGECYLVRNEVFLGSGFLVLSATGFIVCSIIILIRRICRTEQHKENDNR